MRAAERGRTIAESQNFARELSNEPANRLTPTSLAEAARQMAGSARPRVRSAGSGPDAAARHGIAAGRCHGKRGASGADRAALPAREGAAAPRTLGLVGKGVTFDTGGISIKPADGMEKMKYDMAGGAAMIGAMRALAQFKPPIPVTALIPAVENMPGSRAQRPGDIVTSLSGKTIEVINTDAEGRLILADALTYARRLGCTHLVDAATLTGAIVVALGQHQHRRFQHAMTGWSDGCWRPPAPRARRCGACRSTTIIKNS